MTYIYERLLPGLSDTQTSGETPGEVNYLRIDSNSSLNDKRDVLLGHKFHRKVQI